MITYLEANPDTRRAYAIKALSPYFGGMLISQITAAVMRRYKIERRPAPTIKSISYAHSRVVVPRLNKALHALPHRS